MYSVQLPTIAFIKYHFNDQDVGEGQLFEVVKPAVCSPGWDEIKQEPIICCDPMIKANHATCLEQNMNLNISYVPNRQRENHISL